MSKIIALTLTGLDRARPIPGHGTAKRPHCDVPQGCHGEKGQSQPLKGFARGKPAGASLDGEKLSVG